MTVVVFATHRNWNAEAKRLQALNTDLTNKNRTYEGQITALKERLKREQVARQTVLAALETDLGVAQQQAQTAVQENLVLQQQVGTATQQNQTNTALLSTYVTENNGLRTSLTQEQSSRDSIFNKFVAAQDQLHELQGTQNVLTLRNTVLAEDNARFKDIIDRLGPAATTAQE